MSDLQRRTAAVIETRLAAITDTAANLKAQLCELNRLRDRIRKAQLSARRSRRIDHSKERRVEMRPLQLAAAFLLSETSERDADG
jgi:hypothetical protein